MRFCLELDQFQPDLAPEPLDEPVTLFLPETAALLSPGRPVLQSVKAALGKA